MSEERKMILKMLEDGKISVDEAERLLRALQEKGSEEHKSTTETSEETGALSEFVDWERWDERKQTYKQQSSGFKFSQFIENFIQKIKDVDMDFNFGSFEQVKHIYQDHSDEFDSIKIKIKNGAVELTPWEENYVQINCDVKVYRVRNSEEARQRFLHEVHFDISNETLVFLCDARDIKINANIYIPKKQYDCLECKLFNGSVKGQALHTQKLQSKTVNGNITFTDFQTQKAELETGNGSVTVSGESSRLEIETINGAIDLAGAFRDVDAENFSGMITAQLQTDGSASLKSTTGSITVFVPNGVQVNGELLSAIGSVQCDLRSFEIVYEKKELAQRLLKFVSNKNEERIFTLEANTKTGTIQVMEQEA